VFVDTNVFFLFFAKRSVSCDTFLAMVSRGKVVAFVNTEVLSDLLHKLMLLEAKAKGLTAECQATQLRTCLSRDRSRAKDLTAYQEQFEDLLTIGLKVLRITKRLLVATAEERAAHGLLTNDSLHLGTMLRHHPGVTDIVTHDGDFQHIEGITVWFPDDVLPVAS